MPVKKLIIVGTVLFPVALIMWDNMAKSPAESVSDGSTSTPLRFEKDLPTEDKTPTH